MEPFDTISNRTTHTAAGMIRHSQVCATGFRVWPFFAFDIVSSTTQLNEFTLLTAQDKNIHT